MSKVIYRMSELNFRPDYFNTLKEARAQQKVMAEPERIISVNPAEEFNRCEDMEKERNHLLFHLKELIAIAPGEMLKGQNALSFLRGLDPDYVRSCGL